MLRCVRSTALSLVFGIAPCSIAGQSAAADRLAAAQAEVRVMKLDSAAVLLRQTLDMTDRLSNEERVEAWLLLGVVQFYKGDDSGTAVDFRQALALEPRLDTSGLARYDSALVVLLEAQRGGIAAHRDSEASTLGASELKNCVPRCPRNVTPPKPLHRPDVSWMPSGTEQVRGGRGELVVRYVVTARGRVAPGSIVIVSGYVPLGFQSAVLSALARASFLPARDGDRPVAVMVEEKTELERELRMSPP